MVAQKSLGIKAGYSRSSLFSVDETEHVSGFAAGVEFDVSRGGVFGGRFGAAYVQKGGAFWSRGEKIAMGLDYVQLSSLLTAAVLKSDGASGSMALFAGPWVAFRLSCGASAQRGTATLNVSNCGDIEDELSAMDFGFALGIGSASRSRAACAQASTRIIRSVSSISTTTRKTTGIGAWAFALE